MGQKSEYNIPYLLGITLVSALGGLLFGYDLLVISGAKEFYQLYYGVDDPLMQGWAVSSCIVGCILGAFLVGKPAEQLGRAKLLTWSGLLFLISAIGSGFAPNFTQFIVFRLLGGIGMGMASTLSPLYIAEVAPAALRGRFVSLNQLTIVLGILLAQLVNYLILQSHAIPPGASDTELLASWNGQVGWRLMFAAEGIPALLFVVTTVFIPKSPRWLVKKGRIHEAFRVLNKVGGHRYAKQAVKDIKKALGHEPDRHHWPDLLKPGHKKVLIMACIIAIFQQWCGINVIFNYASDIFKDAGYEVSGVLFNLVIIGLTNLAFTLVGMRLIDSVGRRPLLKNGAFALAGCHALMGYCYFTEPTGIYVFFIALLAVAAFAATLGPVAWVMISELFPGRIRAMGMSIAVLCLWVANFILSFTFPVLKESMGPSHTFWFYGLICLAGALFAGSVPETKGQTLEEIQGHFVGQGSSNKLSPSSKATVATDSI